MFREKKILGIIPARGGSKGIIKKNIREVGGKPLIVWIIEAAKKSKYIDRLILSSDDREIIEVARQVNCEVPFVRPKKLAEDTTPTISVLLHALYEIPGFDYAVLLQPTSPLTSPEDIDGAITKCIEMGAPSCISVTEPDKSPYWMFVMGTNDELLPLFDRDYLSKRRQELPRAYVPNGAIYVVDIEWIMRQKKFYHDGTIGYIMPAERSLDIDTELDLAFFQFLLDQIYETGGGQ